MRFGESMKKAKLFISILYILLLISGSLYGIGEKTLYLGGSAAWKYAEIRNNVVEADSIRPNPVLMLSSMNNVAPSLDLSISFNEGDPRLFKDSRGNYKVTVSPELEAVDSRFARVGAGAALFGTAAPGRDGPLVIEPQSRNALFTPGSHIRDFSIEFWLYPLNMGNGEQILSCFSSKTITGAADVNGYQFQRIFCSVVKNRLQWSFVDFFLSPDVKTGINLELSGNSPVTPKTWTHHLIRFDADTGLLEYLVNGESEAIVYATSSGREGGEVYTPIPGGGGIFVLGGRYMGIIDEFNIHSAFINSSSLQKYASSGGRAETRAIDLGAGNGGVLKIEARGGRASIQSAAINSEFRENGRFRFSDDSEMNFFIRSSDNPYLWDADWESFTPGRDISGRINRRYIQLAVDFYPSSDGETSPYLEELAVVYMPGESPLPPQTLTAVATDGGVQLRWRNSPDANALGYMIYYGNVRGEYFSEDALLGPSPIDVGKRNSLFVDGLKNGTLYYFRIAAYNRERQAGEFSREVTARPLSGLSLLTTGIIE